MDDARVWEPGMQAVENRLVRDLSGQAHVARANQRRGAAHQRLAPVRRRAGHVGDAGSGGARQKRAGALTWRSQQLLVLIGCQEGEARRKICRPP